MSLAVEAAKEEQKGKDVEVVETLPEHAVLYSDGGSRGGPPGFGGWAVHGYLFTVAEPKKGAGNAKWLLTKDGYALKGTPGAVSVTPIAYVDGFGSFAQAITNNVAELSGFREALQFASERAVNSVLILADSEYVVKNFNGRMEVWAQNRWTLSNSNPVKNSELWEAILQLKRELVARGVTVRAEWIRGHSGNLGNEAADTLATLGVIHSTHGEIRNEISVESPDGYWKSDVERHPYLNLPYVIFNTEAGLHQPGTYYQLTQGKATEHLGRKTRDGSYAVVHLGEATPVIEKMIARVTEIEEGNSGLCTIDLNAIHRAHIYPLITQYGKCGILQRDARVNDLYSLNEEPLSHILNPPLLSYRAVEKLVEMESVLAEYRQVLADPSVKTLRNYTATPLTDILYETKVKVSKKVETTSMEFKAQYKVGFTKLEVDAAYQDFAGNVESLPVTLVLGIDLPERNALKRLEVKNPNVTLLTWMESEIVFRYASVIQAGDDWGIWMGVFTNQRIIPEKPTVL